MISAKKTKKKKTSMRKASGHFERRVQQSMMHLFAQKIIWSCNKARAPSLVFTQS
jgi:hypothetical protein